LIVFCILAHRDPEMLKDLLGTLGTNKVIIHIDKTSNRNSFMRLLEPLSDNVEVLPQSRSKRIDWAGWHMVEAEMELFSAALPYMTTSDHAILLSGVCHPCRPLTEFMEFLSQNEGRQLISYNRLATTDNLKTIPTRAGTWRVKNLFISDIIMPPIQLVIKLSLSALKFINNLGIQNPRFNPELDYYVGSQFIGCTGNFIDLLLENAKNIRKTFRWSFAPDEMAIHSFCIWMTRKHPEIKTALPINEDKYAVIDAPFHFIRGGSTEITLGNLTEVNRSKKYFVRKPNTELRLKLKELIS